MIIELHALQTFAPSNLNRDDTGNPKDALFGGVRRARFSSQSAKRAMRVSDVFRDAIKAGFGTRTKKIKEDLVQILTERGAHLETATEATDALITEVFAKPDSKKKNLTSVLVYISPEEQRWLADQLYSGIQTGQGDVKEIAKEFNKLMKNRTAAPDIALFGRMLAENPDLSLDAACQVAHSLSTHEVATAEFDYYTAVDDLLPPEETGAGMIGLTAYNSATYYRCIRIDWNQLVNNLSGDVELARQTVTGMMRAFALVVPSAMKNAFLNQHMPDFLVAVVRPYNDGQSLMNAFEQPVRADYRNGGFVKPSVDALCQYWDQVEGAFRLYDPTAIAVMNPRGFELSSTELTANIKPKLAGWVDAITSVLGESERA